MLGRIIDNRSGIYWIESGKGRAIPGYMDCYGSKEVPKTVFLESLESTDSIKEQKTNLQTKMDEVVPIEVKTRELQQDVQIKESITNNQNNLNQKETKQPVSKPKIEILKETTDFSSMLKQDETDSSSNTHILTIEIDSIESINQINLDISAHLIIITSSTTGSEIFRHTYNSPVDPDSASAKWSKKKHELRITVGLTQKTKTT